MLALVLALVIAAGAAASPAPKPPKPPTGKGGRPSIPYTSTTSYAADSLLGRAQANPMQQFDVIVQTSSRTLQHSVARWSDENGNVRRQFNLIDGVAVKLPGWAVLYLAENQLGRMTVTEDTRLTVTGSSAGWQDSVKARPLWPAGGSAAPQGPAIAIVDSGIEDAKAANFGTRIVAHVDFSGDGKKGDPEGHGTMVAGIAAGAPNPVTDGGVAQRAPLVDVRVADSEGEAITSNIIAGLDWVLANKDQYNIRVVNLSLAGATEASFLYDPLDQAVEKLWLNGIAVVAAAGNNGLPNGPAKLAAPGNDPFIITVGALDSNGTTATSDDVRAPWSAYGYTADGFAKPELTAPGRFMVMPVPTGAYIPSMVPDRRVGPGFMWMSGTSFAAPVAAGAAAQILAAHPDWKPDAVKGALMAAATPLATGEPGVGIGEVNVAGAAALATAPNPNEGLDAFVGIDPDTGLRIFSSSSWATVVRTSSNWTSSNWTSSNWTSSNWTSSNWTSSNWTSSNWTSSNWTSSNWVD